MNSDSTDGGYEHDPDRFPLADDEAASTDRVEDDEAVPGGRVGDDDEFGSRGWTLVAVLLVSFFAVPLVIIYRPPNVPFEVAFLVLPLVPAALLGATAVWAMAGRSNS